MKNRKSTLLFGSMTILFAALLLICSSSVRQGVMNGLSCCGSVLIPSLFPFLVASGMFGCRRLAYLPEKLLAPLTTRWFRLPPQAAPALLMGAVGGYPAGAQVAAELFYEGQLSAEDTDRLLHLCVNAGPSFLITAVGSAIFGYPVLGTVIYLSQLLSVLLLGRLMAVGHPPAAGGSIPSLADSTPFAHILVHAVKKAVDATLFICAAVLFFSVLTTVAGDLLPHPAISFLLGFAEVTGGCIGWAQMGIPLWAVAFLLSFGGACVHLQVFSFFPQDPPSYKRFFLTRLLHGFFTAIFTAVMMRFLPISAPVSSAAASSLHPQTASSPLFSALLFLLSAVFLASLPQKERGRLD